MPLEEIDRQVAEAIAVNPWKALPETFVVGGETWTFREWAVASALKGIYEGGITHDQMKRQLDGSIDLAIGKLNVEGFHHLLAKHEEEVRAARTEAIPRMTDAERKAAEHEAILKPIREENKRRNAEALAKKQFLLRLQRQIDREQPGVDPL